MFAVTEVVVRHLACLRVFDRVILVRNAEQGWSEGADLRLRGAEYRCRGDVEARPPAEAMRACPASVGSSPKYASRISRSKIVAIKS